jgi:hypothetical protein
MKVCCTIITTLHPPAARCSLLAARCSLLAARCPPNRFGIIVGDVFSGHPFAPATTAERTRNVHQAT